MDSASRREPRFERIRVIGTGATGRVELARLIRPFGKLKAGQEVAVKSLAPSLAADAEALAAFESEAEAGRLVSDPSLVEILYRGQEEGRPYLLMQYIPGRTLRDALNEGPLPEPLVRSVGAQLSGALAAMHAEGLVHGDVKPENVRLDDEGRAVLLDLGYARLVRDTQASANTGSLAYLSPERVTGGPSSPEADIFALGLVLYELATGLHPFVNAPASSASTHVARPGHIAQLGQLGLGSTSGALIRRSIEVSGADELIAAISRARFVAPSHFEVTLTPFLDQMLMEMLARLPMGRPSALDCAQRLRETESGNWWRARVDPSNSLQRAAPLVRAGKHLSPVVGRDRELQLLFAALEGARAGRSTVVWVTGPEGSGKWRLVSEFAQRARTSNDPPLYLYVRWNEVLEAEPAGALLTLLRRWLRLPTGTPGGDRERRRLEDLVGPRASNTLLAALTPEVSDASSESVAAALIAWLDALGHERPLLLYVDDLHCAGAVTLGAVSTLLDNASGMRALIFLGARDDAVCEEPGFDRLQARLDMMKQAAADAGDEPGVAGEQPFEVITMPLGPLDLASMRLLVDSIFDTSVPRGRLAEVLWNHTQGNPGLATEILYDLVSDGRAIVQEVNGEERWSLTIPPDQLPRPRSLDRIVRERFLHLDAEDRRWLERLSVVGGRIATDYILRAFPPTGRAEIDAVLARLVRLGWLVPVGNRYRFARPTLRGALYRSLGERRRRRLHLSAARGLETESAEDALSSGPPSGRVTAEEIYQRAFHLRAAGEEEELFDLSLYFVRAFSLSAASRRLLTIARWGLEALDNLPEDPLRQDVGVRLELLETAAAAADRLGRRDEERELLDFLVDLDLDLDEAPAEGARLYLLHARYASGTGQFGLARGMLRNARKLAEASDKAHLISQSYRLTSQVQAQVGEFEEAARAAERALATASGSNQIALAHLAIAQERILTDRLEEALEEVDTAVRVLRDGPQLRLGVAAYANLLRARSLRAIGRPARALGAARRAVMLSRRAGERRLEAESRARLGGLLLDLDLPEEAEAQLRDAQLLADEVEDRRGQALVRLWIGLLLWESTSKHAQNTISSGVRLAHEIGYYRAESFGLAILARIHREGGDLEQADETSARSLKLLERHGAELPDRIAVVGTRVLILEELDQGSEAKRLLRELKSRLKRGQRYIKDEDLRRDRMEYTENLLAAVLSPDGPVMPRTRVS